MRARDSPAVALTKVLYLSLEPQLQLPAGLHPFPRSTPHALRESRKSVNGLCQGPHRSAGSHGRDDDVDHLACRGVS